MSGGYEAEPDEDPSVALVERALSEAGTRIGSRIDSRERGAAVHALWICACITEGAAPIWLIHDEEDGSLTWSRVPTGVRPLSLVDAQLTAGGHADPAAVLRWVRGIAADPWSTIGSGAGDDAVIIELGHKIRKA